jgi:hypothetical protein
MYAGTQINWYDNSSISTGSVDIPETDPTVRYLILTSSEKGPEELTTESGDTWLDLYGRNPSFEKHGQPLIQAHNIINAGGVCVTKRLVADDAALSNVAVVATVTKETRNKNDADGNPLYIDSVTGNETTEANGNVRATYDVALISHGLMALEGAKNIDDVVDNAEDATIAESGIYPIYVITDNGRGDTGKKVSFEPQYSLSKNRSYMYYTIKEIEGTTINETATFTLDPSIVVNSKAYALDKNTLTQVKCKTIEKNLYAFVDALAEITGYGTDYLMTQDFLFGKTVKGNQLSGIEFDETSVDISAEYGIELKYGDNGSFGDHPFGTDEYTRVAVRYLSGEVSDEIYDYTVCAPDLIFDANYPDAIKVKLAEFADQREDIFFFRDLGLDITSYEMLYDRYFASNVSASKWNGTYSTSYDVYDPVTAKPIQVTMLYSMAPLMVDFFANGRYRPLCGASNGMAITDYIPGTVRYTPRITPKVNQKSLMEDMRINYAAKISASSDNLIIETCYTSQEAFTQASYINNILSIQQVVKAVRDYSPSVRYQFYTSNDFSDYAKVIDENVLQKYATQFNSLNLVYTQDDTLGAQKIFKASIEVACGTFIQTEIYDVFIINA